MRSLTDWIGSNEDAEDIVTSEPLARLAALLDHERPPWRAGEVPPLGHWLYCLPRARQGELADDGHPRRGGFLPPVSLPRRMWAGGSIEFIAPIHIGDRIRRISTVTKVEEKTGQSGDLVFVRVTHEVLRGDQHLLREEQDLGYRGASAQVRSAPNARGGVERPALPHWQRTVRADSVLLFRFSALTFNGHRIHYDREYCREVEGYPGLLVHAPLTLTLLVDLFLRHATGARIKTLSYRAQRPLFDTAPFTLNGAASGSHISLWAANEDPAVAMAADLEVE